MTEPRHLHLVDRLRGQYHLPVNDGAGPLNGSMTFSREFRTPAIQKEAAEMIEQLLAALRKAERLADIASDWNLSEVEIEPDGMVQTLDLRDEFRAAIAKADGR